MESHVENLAKQVAALTAEIVGLRAEVAELRSSAVTPEPSAAWSLKAAAEHLGVSKCRTLVPAIERGTIKTFRRGKRKFISAAEMERLRREWMPTVKSEKRATPDRSARRYPDSCAL